MMARMARDAIKGTAVAPEVDLEEMEWEDRASIPAESYTAGKGPNSGNHLTNKVGKAVERKYVNKTNLTKYKTDLQ